MNASRMEGPAHGKDSVMEDSVARGRGIRWRCRGISL